LIPWWRSEPNNIVIALEKFDLSGVSVKAGIAHARAKGIVLGRPKSAAKKSVEVRPLYRKERLTKSEIARRLGIGRISEPWSTTLRT
jgi:DNA invertase Pin-like site-specific DNA recombinase